MLAISMVGLYIDRSLIIKLNEKLDLKWYIRIISTNEIDKKSIDWSVNTLFYSIISMQNNLFIYGGYFEKSI